MKTLFLHIGHGKTGSSWIQASLGLSVASLAAAGITYPGTPAGGLPTRITSGNARGLLASPQSLETRLRVDAASGAGSFLYSSEWLSTEILGGPSVIPLGEVAARHGFARVAVLLFIRDPIASAASVWQQLTKRHGQTQSIESLFARYELPRHAAEILERLDAIDGIEVTVRNYSRCRDRLLDETAAWLGIPRDTLVSPPAIRVNRSMTRAELAVQQVLNRHLGECGELVSDPLCELLPDIEPEDVYPSLAVQEQLWDRLRPFIDRVNARLPVDHQYQCDLREPPVRLDPPALHLEQITVIADSLGAEIARLRQSAAQSGRPADRPSLRDRLGQRLRRLMRSGRSTAKP